jgi:hypothetical protein
MGLHNNVGSSMINSVNSLLPRSPFSVLSRHVVFALAPLIDTASCVHSPRVSGKCRLFGGHGPLLCTDVSVHNLFRLWATEALQSFSDLTHGYARIPRVHVCESHSDADSRRAAIALLAFYRGFRNRSLAFYHGANVEYWLT